jgi:transcriptional regulator with XRE-family HTH domain
MRLYLQAWRYAADLSQETVAEQLGITRSGLSRYEGGSRPLPVALLWRIAALYGCSVDDLSRPPALVSIS